MTPQNATEAQAKLSALYADADWRGRLEAGNIAVKGEYRALMDEIVSGERGPDVLSIIANGKLPDGASQGQKMMGAQASRMRDLGFTAGEIENALSDKVPAPEEIETARVAKTRAMQDPDWVQRYSANGGAERREMESWNITLSKAPADLSRT